MKPVGAGAQATVNGNEIFEFHSARMPPEFAQKYETECLNTRLPLLILMTLGGTA